MLETRHRAGNHRYRREARLRYRHQGDPSVRCGVETAGLCRQFRADGIRHRRHLRLPGARPARPRLFFFSSRRRHTSSVSAFLLNRSSDLTPLIRLFLLVLILLLMPTLNFLPVWFALSLLRFRLPSRLPMMFILWMVAMMVVIIPSRTV